MPPEGSPRTSARRARRLALMLVLLLLVLFLGLKRLIQAERANWPAWSNRLTPAEHVAGRGPQSLEVQTPIPLGEGGAHGPAGLLERRVAAAAGQADWLAEPYRPSPALFGDLPDGASAGWSEAVSICMSNPFLLLSLEAVHAPARVVPAELTWWAHEARAEARLHLVTSPRGSAPLRLRVHAFNAVDFGLGYLQITVGEGRPGDVLSIPKEIVPGEGAWAAPDVDVLTVHELPTRVRARLWTEAPDDADMAPDLRFDMLLERPPR